jgi:large subunit ribosomal protein L4e
MNAKIFNLDGSEKGEVAIPSVFSAEYRPDLIKRAVISSLTAKLQPKGSNLLAGHRTSAKSIGKGHGRARVRRTAQGGGAFVPQAVGGRRAHGPKVEKILLERINRKERLKALQSAIAASANVEIVKARGHIIPDVPALPLIVSEEFESIVKTKDALDVFKALKLDADLTRAKEGISIKAGKGKLRGRKYKKPRSVLVVVSKACDAVKASKNIAGVDVITADDLGTMHIAPGTAAGRLTLWTEGAIEALKEKFE